MAFIRYKEQNFKKYLQNHFGIELPKDVEIFYAQGVRVGNKELRKSKIQGELGYAACDFGFNPTNALIQNFGRLATKNLIEVKEEDAKRFAEGQNIKIDLSGKTKYVIVKFKEIVIGLGQYDSKKKLIINKIPEKRRRKIINEFHTHLKTFTHRKKT